MTSTPLTTLRLDNAAYGRHLVKHVLSASNRVKMRVNKIPRDDVNLCISLLTWQRWQLQARALGLQLVDEVLRGGQLRGLRPQRSRRLLRVLLQVPGLSVSGSTSERGHMLICR